MKKLVVPLAMAFALTSFAPAFADATSETPPKSDEKKEESTPSTPSTTPSDPSTTKPEEEPK